MAVEVRHVEWLDSGGFEGQVFRVQLVDGDKSSAFLIRLTSEAAARATARTDLLSWVRECAEWEAKRSANVGWFDGKTFDYGPADIF